MNSKKEQVSLKVGDIVVVDHWLDIWNGRTGKITEIGKGHNGDTRYAVTFNGKDSFWFTKVRRKGRDDDATGK